MPKVILKNHSYLKYSLEYNNLSGDSLVYVTSKVTLLMNVEEFWLILYSVLITLLKWTYFAVLYVVYAQELRGERKSLKVFLGNASLKSLRKCFTNFVISIFYVKNFSTEKCITDFTV